MYGNEEFTTIDLESACLVSMGSVPFVNRDGEIKVRRMKQVGRWQAWQRSRIEQIGRSV
jgi:hypothetical protein